MNKWYYDIPEIELAWMAGFFDGEGSVRVGVAINKLTGTKCFHRRVCVTNTRREVLEVFKKYFKGTIREQTHMAKWCPNGKSVYVWNCDAKQSAYCIGMLKPYLKLKAYHADLYMLYDSLVDRNLIYDRKDSNNRFSPLKEENIKARESVVNALRIANHRGKLDAQYYCP